MLSTAEAIIKSGACLEEVFPPVSLKLVPISLDNIKEHRQTSSPNVQFAPSVANLTLKAMSDQRFCTC